MNSGDKATVDQADDYLLQRYIGEDTIPRTDHALVLFHIRDRIADTDNICNGRAGDLPHTITRLRKCKVSYACAVTRH